jgi:N utilization substance protein B
MARSVARTAAMQMIYERLSGGDGNDDSLRMIYDELRDEQKLPVKAEDPGINDRAFITRLLEGVLSRLDEIDQTINSFSHRWTVDRMPRVDLTILRLAVWEILFENDPEIPPEVVVAEAVEMAKQYSEEESSRFINGVLGAIVRSDRNNHA